MNQLGEWEYWIVEDPPAMYTAARSNLFNSASLRNIGEGKYREE